jgi:signal transduction histidine kinase
MVAWLRRYERLRFRVFGRNGEIRSAARVKSGSAGGRMCACVEWMYVHRMRDRVANMLRNPRVQGAGDAVLAAFLAGTSLLGVLTGDLSWGTSKPIGVALALASTVPLAWRARRPLLVAAVVLAANGWSIFAAAPRQAAFQPFLALVLAAYSVGSRAEGRRALWVPPVLAAAVIPLFAVAVLHGQSAGNAIPSFVWLVVAWVVGRSVRSWGRKNVALEIANRELKQQRELQAQAAIMVERGRIARELHDVVAHNVSMMVVQAGAAARVLDGEQPDVRNALDVIAAAGRETVDEMRTLLGVLRSDDGPSALKPQPGLADLEQLVIGLREAGLPVTLQVEGVRRPLPAALDLSAFRIVQEALTNTLKHAGPARAMVTVRYQDGAVELEIADNGRGPSGGHSTGHGLVGMRERAAMFGGELEAAGSGSGGFRVRARLPAPASVPA